MRVYLSERAYTKLKAMILDGRFAADALLSERELAARLTLSRMPVREAVKALQREGLLVVVPQSGIHLPRPTVQDIRDIYEVRQAIEGVAAFLCATRATRDEKRALRRRLARVYGRRRKLDQATIQQESRLFHRTLFRLCGNTELAHVYATIEPKIDLNLRLTAVHAPERVQQALVEHLNIAKAIKSGNAREAERLIRSSLENGKRTRIALLSDWNGEAVQPPRRLGVAIRAKKLNSLSRKRLNGEKTSLNAG